MTLLRALPAGLEPVAVNNFGDTREGALAGPLALAVVALLAVATILLWRNMNARIKRLPTSFPDDGSPPGVVEPGADAAAEPLENGPARRPEDDPSS